MRVHLVFVAVVINAVAVAGAALQEAASFPDQQVTGVGVSTKSGRVFVNFPYWSDQHSISVAEIVNGQPKPFPNEEWNKPGAADSHFVCVQSVVVDDHDNLWVLDPAAPKMQEIVKGGPKLVKIDLQANQVIQTIPFGEDIAPAKSYLNDVRIDTRSDTAFITDSGKGAIIVVNLKNGNARRLLDGHPSTQPEKGFKLVVEGRELIDQQKKAPPQIASDGIALDAKNGYLYYHVLTAHKLYRIKTSFLTGEQLSKTDLESKVESVGETPAPDGMVEAPDGSIYLTDLEHNAVVRWNPETKSIEQVIADKRLMWPDTLSWGPNDELYVTTSQIENTPRFNDGKSTRTEPYKLWKIPGVNRR
ncbi:MAG TPA: L-dopachrome tautomerase-related protein [Candidatus Acidoferrum sp.]|nr:L-dopachrome tautomerase-related protein [Candidatus Acidoferrum sp.]